MHDDEPPAKLSPAQKAARLQAEIYDSSIGQLEDRIAALQAEIALCEQAIAQKKAQRGAADQLFGPKS